MAVSKRTNKQYNLHIYNSEKVSGAFDMPTLAPIDFAPDAMLAFNECASKRSKTACGIHFFIDDYQFERVWKEPERYARMLSKYQCVLTPDYSLYTDMPIVMQMWNTYRSRLLGQYWQSVGLKVIPTVSWSDADSYDWCFDGLPKQATLAISTIGLGRDAYAHQLFINGLDEMISRLMPVRLIVYGRCDYHFPKSITVNRYDNERLEFLHDLNALRRAVKKHEN